MKQQLNIRPHLRRAMAAAFAGIMAMSLSVSAFAAETCPICGIPDCSCCTGSSGNQSNAVPTAVNFTDAPDTSPFYTGIIWCAEQSIVGGYSDGTFKPTNTVSRSNFVVMLSRAFYADDVAKYNNDFNKSFGAFVPNYMALNNAGVWENLSFDSSNMFNTGSNFMSEMNRGISRYDMAQLMTNIMSKNGFSASASDKSAAIAKISDYNNIPSQYRDAVANVYALGVIGGFSDGTFGGNATMNRGQGAIVIYRMIQKMYPNGEQPTPDPEAPIDPGTGEMACACVRLYGECKCCNTTGTTGSGSGNTGTGTGSGTTTPSTPDIKPETPSGATLSNGKAITEANVKELVNELKAKYPTNALYANKGASIGTNIYRPFGYSSGSECAGWAALVSDYIFGKNATVRTHQDFDHVRIGDVLYSEAHKCVVMNVAPCQWCHKPAFATSDSNVSYKVAWYDDYNIAGVCNNPSCAGYHGTPTDDPYIIITRYPADSTVPYLNLN